MSSRKEEERNEKIIRGLMKLPPNRRCINCNSLGPQYVCTNFWTFVCMTCSGIHREFTHRVKSVSMAKFTSQEVEALQNGGNQRAREIYLKEWDSQRLRFPDNSNADKIREFIKSVYIDKKFVGGKSSDRPPRDSQKLSNHEEETRRASSYHSYSQSPPYDFQYEERRYGRHAPVLSRKPGSDRGLYDGKFSSFLSPGLLTERSSGHFSDHVYEDGFANEQSNSRISEYPASSGGDPFRSGVQSPNLQKDIGSPSSETSRDFSGDDVVNYARNAYPDSYARRDGGRIPRPQRTASSGSFGSFDSNSPSFKSVNTAGLLDVTPEPEQPAETHSNDASTFASLPQSSIPGSDGLDLFSLPFAPKNAFSTASAKDVTSLPGNTDGLDLFSAPYAPQNVTYPASTASISHVPELSSAQSLDLFEPSPTSATPTLVPHQVPQTIPQSPIDSFSDMPGQETASTFSEKASDVLVSQKGGWATFDMPQYSAAVVTQNSAPARTTSPSSSSISSSVKDPLVSLDQWPLFHDITSHTPSSAQTSRNEAPEHVKAMPKTVTTETWNAFEDSSEQLGFQNVLKSNQSSTSDQFLSLSVQEEFNKDGSQNVAVDSLHPLPSVSSHNSMTPDDLSMPPSVAQGTHPYPVDQKSTNPFDLPCDPEIDYGNTSQFWDMSSLQAALPNGPLPTLFTSGTNQPWFHQDPMSPYDSEGALFMVGQPSNAHISTVPSQGPVASIGGNPFA